MPICSQSEEAPQQPSCDRHHFRNIQPQQAIVFIGSGSHAHKSESDIGEYHESQRLCVEAAAFVTWGFLVAAVNGPVPRPPAPIYMRAAPMVCNTLSFTTKYTPKMISLWILVACIIAWRLHVSHSHLSKITKGIPWSNGRFTPYLLAQISAIWNSPKYINEAYEKVHLTLETSAF